MKNSRQKLLRLPFSALHELSDAITAYVGRDVEDVAQHDLSGIDIDDLVYEVNSSNLSSNLFVLHIQ